MAISEAARRNHDELFGDRVSTLGATDPELVEYFDNFTLGDVVEHGDVDLHTRLLVQLAALIACQARGEYRVVLGAALAHGVTPVEAKEIVYQAVAYLGMGKVYDFLHLTNEVLRERGVALPLPAQSTTTPQTRFAEGWTAQAQIVGEDRLTAMHADAPRTRNTSRTG